MNKLTFEELIEPDVYLKVTIGHFDSFPVDLQADLRPYFIMQNWPCYEFRLPAYKARELLNVWKVQLGDKKCLNLR